MSPKFNRIDVKLVVTYIMVMVITLILATHYILNSMVGYMLKEEKINQYFDSIKNILTSIPSPKLAQALHFVNNIKEVDRIIVGTTCQKDLEEIVLALNENVENLDYAKYAISDERFILPQNWRL